MSPEGAIQKSIIAMACVAPAGAPFYSDPYRGFAALTPGYFLSPLRGFKKYAALGETRSTLPGTGLLFVSCILNPASQIPSVFPML